MSPKFGNILALASLWHVYHTTKAIQGVEGSIVAVGALTHSALLYDVCDLRANRWMCNIV